MKNKIDYSLYRCPYEHLEKDDGHELTGPEGYEDTYSVWCSCGFRGPVRYLDPGDLKLIKKDDESQIYMRCNIEALNVSKKMVVIDYYIRHNNGTTTVKQSMRLIKENGKWEAEIGLSGFPGQDTPDRAAMKLAEWLTRLGAAIEQGKYDKVKLEELGM